MRVIKYCLLVHLICSCTNNNSDNTCFELKKADWSLYLESYKDRQKCTYELNDFFGIDSDNYFFFKSGVGYIGSDREDIDPQILFSYTEPIATKRNIKIRAGNWAIGEGMTMKLRNIEVEKINQFQCGEDEIIQFKINDWYTDGSKVYGVNILFSNRIAFSGSFLSDNSKPQLLIGLSGDIFEECHDYGDKERVNIN